MPDQKISFLLNGGQDERSQEETFAPTIQQGSSPLLAASRNTRLSVRPGTCVRSPKFSNVGGYGPDVYGVVPSASGNNAVIFARQQQGGNKVIADAGRESYGSGSLISSFGALFRQNCYMPVEMVGAGAIPTAQAYDAPATLFDNQTGLIWFAFYTPTDIANQYALIAVAQSEDGAVAGPPLRVTTVAVSGNQYRWLGLTGHGINGIRVWYMDGGVMRVRRLSITGNVISTSSPNVAHTPATANDLLPAVSSDPSNGSTNKYAFIAVVSPSNPDDGYILRYDVTNNTSINQTYPGALQGTYKWCSIKIGNLQSAQRIIFSFNQTTAGDTLTGMCGTGLGTTWTQLIAGETGLTTCSFLDAAAVKCVFAIEGVDGVKVWFVPLAGGSVQSGPIVASASQYIGMSEWRPTSNECYPILFTSVSTTLDADDPAVTAWLIGDIYLASPFARWGCVRGAQLPVGGRAALYSSGSTFTSTGHLVAAYAQKSFTTACGDGRYVRLRFMPSQPSIAHDKDGCTLVAGALPAQWDGVEVVEIGGPLHTPQISVQTTGGSGTVLPAGVYRFRVMYRWADASGLTHRSRPSEDHFITSDGATTKPKVTVTIPQSLKNGATQERIDVVLYASAVDGLTLHEVDAQPSYRDFWEAYWDNLPDSLLNGAGALLYSTGAAQTELTPQPPPPLWDIAVVGSRAWGIDAESRSRLVFSKLRVAGVGFEFHPALEVIFPGGAGKLMAVREWQGMPLVLTERGVYQIAGDGPNNANLGGAFGSPVKLSDIGCTNRNSVVVCPGGIAWQSDVDFVTLTPAGGVQIVNTVNAEVDVSGTAVLKNQDEAVFWMSASAEAKVWNYRLDRWTTWDNYTHGVVSHVANHPVDQDVVLVLGPGASTSDLYRVDGDEAGAALGMTWETDWLLPGGDFQDRVLVRSVIVNGKSLGAHSLTVQVFTDYKYDVPTSERTWDYAALSSLAVGGRWTVRMEPDVQVSRGFKIRISDQLTGEQAEGFEPRSVTVVYAVDGMLNEDVFLQGSYD